MTEQRLNGCGYQLVARMEVLPNGELSAANAISASASDDLMAMLRELPNHELLETYHQLRQSIVSRWRLKKQTEAQLGSYTAVCVVLGERVGSGALSLTFSAKPKARRRPGPAWR